jgi:hypothetical protein
MKIVCVSDLHGLLPEVPSCDLLLIGGDICPAYDHTFYFQQVWLRDIFYPWLKKQPAKNKVLVAGNHDFIFQEFSKYDWKNFFNHPMMTNKSCYYLQDDGVDLDGLKIWGSPWQLPFYDWAFNLPEAELQKKWELIPQDTDIILLHGPPCGYGDRVIAHENEEEWPRRLPEPNKKNSGNPTEALLLGSYSPTIRQISNR